CTSWLSTVSRLSLLSVRNSRNRSSMNRSPQGATERTPRIDNLAGFTATLISSSVQIRTMKPFKDDASRHRGQFHSNKPLPPGRERARSTCRRNLNEMRSRDGQIPRNAGGHDIRLHQSAIAHGLNMG
ncbi:MULTISPECIES: hypothetical protein, partial [unclassified Bradyrhizobium]|uniref:hypothetical protein n=1 Tax=unclassified Bradyrhizobium TaxID=2631580 RepID=UPI001BA69A28